MRSIARVVMLALATSTTLGCGDDPGGAAAGEGVEVRDSAGVEIVLNRQPSTPIAITEELRLGTLEGPEEEQFFRVRPPVESEDGTIYVPLLGTGEIRVFAADGTHLRTMGGMGDGPGEFRGLSRVYPAGEALAALDMAGYRVTVFGPDGAVEGTVPLPREEDFSFTTPAARFGEGWLLSRPIRGEWPDHGETLERVMRVMVVPGTPDVLEALRAVESGSVQVEPLVDVAWTRTLGMDQAGVQTGLGPLWASTSSWATDGSSLYVTSDEGYAIEVLDGTGTPVRSIRRDHEAVPVTDAMREAFLDHVIRHHDTTDVQTEFGTDPVDIERFRLERSETARLPALDRLLVGADGGFLVERPDLVADPVAIEWTRLGPQESHWDRFDPTGRYLGTVTFPPRFSPSSLSENGVLGIHRDELGVEYVVRFGFAG